MIRGEQVLVSVHVPKAAGTSFAATLRNHFGSELYLDYEDTPVHRSRAERRDDAVHRQERTRSVLEKGAACVHGHFVIKKWTSALDSSASYITWLRDPIDRLVSHYDYWRRTYKPERHASIELHRRMVEERWDFERFAFEPQIRNLASELLWGIDREELAFVGIVEQYPSELRRFARQVLGQDGCDLGPVHRLNAADPRGEVVPTSLRSEVEAFHAADVELYEWALARSGTG